MFQKKSIIVISIHTLIKTQKCLKIVKKYNIFPYLYYQIVLLSSFSTTIDLIMSVIVETEKQPIA